MVNENDDDMFRMMMCLDDVLRLLADLAGCVVVIVADNVFVVCIVYNVRMKWSVVPVGVVLCILLFLVHSCGNPFSFGFGFGFGFSFAFATVAAVAATVAVPRSSWQLQKSQTK